MTSYLYIYKYVYYLFVSESVLLKSIDWTVIQHILFCLFFLFGIWLCIISGT